MLKTKLSSVTFKLNRKNDCTSKICLQQLNIYFILTPVKKKEMSKSIVFLTFYLTKRNYTQKYNNQRVIVHRLTRNNVLTAKITIRLVFTTVVLFFFFSYIE